LAQEKQSHIANKITGNGTSVRGILDRHFLIALGVSAHLAPMKLKIIPHRKVRRTNARERFLAF
jgi:hypothetical protein